MPRQRISIVGALPANSNRDAVQATQRVRLSSLSEATINYTIYGDDDSLLNMAGGALVSYVRQVRWGSRQEGDVVVEREATITGLGTGSHDVVAADYALLPPGRYVEDAYFVFPDGSQQRAVKPFFFIVDEAITIPTGPVTVPVQQQPLAQGPAGLYSFRYVFTGSEGTTFNVPLPAAIQAQVGSLPYDVAPVFVSGDSVPVIACPIAGRAPTQFQCVLDVALAAASVVEFGVALRVT